MLSFFVLFLSYEKNSTLLLYEATMILMGYRKNAEHMDHGVAYRVKNVFTCMKALLKRLQPYTRGLI